jgi:hypothetical protein
MFYLNFFIYIYIFFICCDSCVELFLYVVMIFIFYFNGVCVFFFNFLMFLSTSKCKFGVKYF